jgi:signal transduction histidine kinase
MAVESGQDALTTTQATADAARDAIAEARAKRDELFVLASHDMKNSIGILDSALDMIEDAPAGAAEMHAMMRRATHRLGVLVRALVDVDLLQRDLMPVVPADVGWKAIATNVVEGTLAVARTKGVEVSPCGDLAARLTCDAPLVERMATALLDHAIANAPPKSTVELEGTRLDDRRFRLRVAYRGRVVSAEALDRYFTTLPLRFCRLAAIRHGGSLRAVSPVVDGQGLAFEVELPG